MIFVMLGTNPYPFTRLLDQVIKWSIDNSEHIIVQAGNTPVLYDHIEHYSFIDHSKVIEFILNANIVITQGGFGSLQDCLKVGAKVVAVPRLVELGESQDDQKEIVNALAAENLLVPLFDVSMLSIAIDSARKLQVQKTANSKLPDHIASTIRDLLGK